jgi:hypothetical protein
MTNHWPTYEQWIAKASPEAMVWMIESFGDTRIGFEKLIAELERRNITPAEAASVVGKSSISKA